MSSQAAQMVAQVAQQSYSFTGLELFFICATLFSILLNLWQFMSARRNRSELLKPLLNTLTGFFNDVKTKTLSLQNAQQMLIDPQNPHKEIVTLQSEYYHFTGSIIDTLRGYQETLVGALVTLNPKDKDGVMTFKAADYGLTPQEKENRSLWIRKKHDQQLKTMQHAIRSSDQSVSEPAVSQKSEREPEEVSERELKFTDGL